MNTSPNSPQTHVSPPIPSNPSSGLPEVVPIQAHQIFGPLRRQKKLIILFAVIGTIVGGAIRIYRGIEYRASAAIMVVSSSEGGPLPAGIAGALMGASQTATAGQASPALLVKFAAFNSVLMQVAKARGPEPRQQTVIEQIAKPGVLKDQGKWTDEINKHFDVALDQRTGIVRLTVDYRDSVLARYMLRTAVGAIGSAFQDAARGQATGQRIANEVRAQKAREQLRIAEQRLTSFLSANRGIARYSQANITLQNLERDVQIAQNLYMQAAGDRETAHGKELQQTPAVMVVDAVPDQLPRVPRRLWFWMAVGMFIGVVVIIPVILWRANTATGAKGAVRG